MTCNEMAFYPVNFMPQRTLHQDQLQPPPSLHPNVLPSCTPQDLHGVASYLGKRSTSFSGMEGCQEEANINIGEDELSDDGSQAGEKKRRLNMEQVKTLEENFELGNKLEPERKMQLARALGLQPRQISIWFQNRRARWRTKQLEKDYDLLKRQFEASKAENDSLQAQNRKLHAEILALKSSSTESINLNKETEGSSSNRSENSSEIKLDISRSTPPNIDSPMSNHQITSIPFFPPSYSSIRPPPNVAQALLQTNPSSRHDHVQFQNQMVKEESLSNMFCGIDDHSGFWPWLEQHHFN